MTILAGFSSSRQGSCAAEPGGADIALHRRQDRRRGDRRAAVAAERRPGRGRVPAATSRRRRRSHSSGWSASCPAISTSRSVVHQSTSIPTGLIGTRCRHQRRSRRRRVVVVGAAGPGGVGQCDRPAGPYRGGARGDRSARLPAGARPDTPADRRIRRRSRRRRPHRRGSAELAKQWSVRLRIASFTVRPVTMFGGSIEPSAEDLVVQQWSRRTFDDIAKQLNACSRPHRGSRRRRGDRNRPRLARGRGRRSLGIRRHAAARIGRGRTNGSGIPRLGRLEDPASRPGARDDRAETPNAGIGRTRPLAGRFRAASFSPSGASAFPTIGGSIWSIVCCCGRREIPDSSTRSPTTGSWTRRCTDSSREHSCRTRCPRRSTSTPRGSAPSSTFSARGSRISPVRARRPGQYLEAVEVIAERGIDSTVSLKLSQLGLTVDGAACAANLAMILERAQGARGRCRGRHGAERPGRQDAGRVPGGHRPLSADPPGHSGVPASHPV